MEFLLPNIVDEADKSSSLKNRLRKNYRHLRKWAKRTQTNCFRIYDREIPYYPLAIDFYDGRFCVHYFSRIKSLLEPPPKLVDEVNVSLCALFAVTLDRIYWRTRTKRKKVEQYEKADLSSEFFIVQEYGVNFKVNLKDYLDTGLFLDHRETRKMVAAIAKDKRVLNLFAYTCSFSVHAAHAKAAFTKSVDMSNTYTEWGRDNFCINKISLENNEIVRADCMKFLDAEIRAHEKYDVIIIDPPTLSRSKKMDGMFDVQLDYSELISKSLELLNTGGVIFFSTNLRKFVFDSNLFPRCSIRDISKKTIPLDFQDPRIHRCWEIRAN